MRVQAGMPAEESPCRRVMAKVQYDGTDFLGFQRQALGRTVQAELERALAKLLAHPVHVKGAGRTDAGVHARGQVISFLTESSVPSPRIPTAVARYLPPDITLSGAEDVPLDFDPQKCATSKTYCYRIWRGEAPDILLARYTHWYPGFLDLDLMEEESRYLVGRHDFLSFRATGSSPKTTVREVKEVSWSRSTGRGGEVLEFWISADGFLYKMVRLIVGTLLDIGRGYLSEGTVARLLSAPGEMKPGRCAPARGLCLEKVSFS